MLLRTGAEILIYCLEECKLSSHYEITVKAPQNSKNSLVSLALVPCL